MLLFPEKADYPQDFYYHRTSSPTYREYLQQCHLDTFDTEIGPQFFWRKKIFGDFFGVVKYERIDQEPDIDYIKNITGLRHAFVVWIPYSKLRRDLSRAWRKLWFTDHFEETGFAILDDRGQMTEDSSKAGGQDYLSSWNDRAKRALKKFEKSGCHVRTVTPDEFAEAFRTTKVKHWHKSVYIGYYKKMVAIDPDHVRQWLAYDSSGRQIGGLAVHDYLSDHSVHLVAFTDQRSYDLQPGTGLMGEWYRDSHERGYRYLSVDHLRNTGGPNDQKGYTAFKENFISTRLSFREAYFRFF